MDREMLIEIKEVMEKSPKLEGEHMPEGWKKLSEFNDIILAGKKTGRLNRNDEYEFVTWRRSGTSGVGNGHYTNSFDGAKKDFARRKHKNIEKLTRSIVVSLIDKIIISDEKNMKIIYKYQDKLEKVRSIFEKD